MAIPETASAVGAHAAETKGAILITIHPELSDALNRTCRHLGYVTTLGATQ